MVFQSLFIKKQNRAQALSKTLMIYVKWKYQWNVSILYLITPVRTYFHCIMWIVFEMLAILLYITVILLNIHIILIS